MITKNECFQHALQLVRNSRHRAIEATDSLRGMLLNQSPEFKAVEQRLMQLSRQKMNAKIRNDMIAYKDFDTQYQTLYIERGAILNTLGFSPEELNPVFRCKTCEDTGMVNNGYCDCVKQLAHRILLRDLCDRIPTEEFTFDRFSLAYYTDPQEHAQMETVFHRCREYANTFSKGSESLYLLGNTGLGKTHLTFSIVKEVAAKGYSVIYCSTPNLITQLEKEHFGRADERVSEYYLSCDLLVLDDLGTEFLSPVAQSALYNVIDHRCLMKLPTIINSNLTPKELEERYGKRLLSRIVGCYATLQFVGKDIRIQKRLISKKV